MNKQNARKYIVRFKNFYLLLFFAAFFLIGLRVFTAQSQNKQTPETKNYFNKFLPINTTTTNTPSVIQGQTYYINTSGNDTNAGTNTTNPWRTIQKGVDTAQPGDAIALSPGIYFQDVITKTNGTAEAPITIFGPKDAVIKGQGNPRIFEVNHNFITLKGFTIDGLFGNADNIEGYRDKLLYIQGKGVRSGVTGLKVIGLQLKNAGGECLRLRYFSHDNEIRNSKIGPCGIIDFKFSSKDKNGEGIYIGTSSNQWGDKKNPTNDPDGSTRNWIHHNIFNTQGNECVDAKEGSFNNIIEYNSCTGQKDPESGGFDSRGDSNIFRNNEIYENLGSGVRLGGHTVNGITYGKNNKVYDNIIRDNKNGALSIQVIPQGKICGNKISNNGDRIIVGSYDNPLNPSTPCNK